eukprot:6196227-Pleurochrysis_carterae.AAC.1
MLCAVGGSGPGCGSMPCSRRGTTKGGPDPAGGGAGHGGAGKACGGAAMVRHWSVGLLAGVSDAVAGVVGRLLQPPAFAIGRYQMVGYVGFRTWARRRCRASRRAKQ